MKTLNENIEQMEWLYSDDDYVKRNRHFGCCSQNHGGI
jgi:hypothetical protein